MEIYFIAEKETLLPQIHFVVEPIFPIASSIPPLSYQIKILSLRPVSGFWLASSSRMCGASSPSHRLTLSLSTILPASPILSLFYSTSLLPHLPSTSELISSLFTFNHLSSSSLMIVSSNQPRSPMVVFKLQLPCLWCRWLCSILHSSYSSIPIVLARKVCSVVHKIHTNLYKFFLALLISCSLYISYFHHLFDYDIICSTLMV